MKVDNISYYYKSPMNFSGNKFSRVIDNLSMRNFYADTNGSEFRELRQIYNRLWKNLSLPENLKPRLQYQAILSNMGFSMEDYMIFVEKRLSPFKMKVRNKTGKNEAILRHEIEHVIQLWEIIRLIGAENTADEFRYNVKGVKIRVTPKLLKKMHIIENTLGRIEPNSEEGIKAKNYLEGLKNYPNTSQYYGILSIKELMEHLKYKKNILEINANKEATKYEPSILRILKIGLKEFFNLVFG